VADPALRLKIGPRVLERASMLVEVGINFGIRGNWILQMLDRKEGAGKDSPVKRKLKSTRIGRPVEKKQEKRWFSWG